MRNVRWVAISIAIGLLAWSPAASARAVHFFGPHPIAARYGGGYCYLEGPHVHVYAPDHQAALYHDVGGELVFTADPTPFGYDGPRFAYYGPHPIPGAPGTVYCYLEGPHYHPFAPPEGPDFRVRADVAFYVGPFDPGFYRERPHRERQVAVIYRPYVAQRPVVTIAPPPEWHGSVWVAPPSVDVRAGVAVPAPSAGVSVEVNVPPPPSVHLEFGAGFAPPAGGVVVGGPPPAQPVYVDDERRHHDHGEHRGWFHRGEGDEHHDHDHDGRGHHGHDGWRHHD